MTFLQPILLYALPLILLPVIIHLINRLRYRRQDWAAMPFLLAASQSSVSHARLKQLLVLLLRVLAVLALILALTRPLAGGWLGWSMAAAPDAVLLLLDRSASMNRVSADGETSGLDLVRNRFAEAAQGFDGQSLLVLIDSALRDPVEITQSGDLTTHASTSPTDTEADIPAMIQGALDWLLENQAGTAEIWLGSDLQSSNWKPGDSRWEQLIQDFSSLPQTVKFRLLQPGRADAQNISLSLVEFFRRYTGSTEQLSLVADIAGEKPMDQSIPMTLWHEKATTQVELTVNGTQFRWRHLLPLGGEGKEGGWSYLELPADSNMADNRTWLVYGPRVQIKAGVYADLPLSGKILGLASRSLLTLGDEEGAIYRSPQSVTVDDWSDYGLLIWQGPFPSGETAGRLMQFADEGGQVLFLPPGDVQNAGSFNGVTWGPPLVSESEGAGALTVGRWERFDGPLQDTDEGFQLPVEQLEIYQALELQGGGRIYASFSDGNPLLTGQTMGNGMFYYLTTLPETDWSTLLDGGLLVPLVQRLLERGAMRLENHKMDYSGLWRPLSPAVNVINRDGAGETRDYRIHAGVYTADDQWIALNIPPSELQFEFLDAQEAVGLFGELGAHYFEDQSQDTTPLQGEIWRGILLLMLILLLVEAALILPPASPKTAKHQMN